MKRLIFAVAGLIVMTACADSTSPKNDCYLKPKTRIPVCNFDF